MSDKSASEELKTRWAEEDRLEIENVYQDLLSAARGRKFLFYLLGVARVGQQPFAPNALQMSFNCGELNVGQKLLSDILSAQPEGWILMQKEANDAYRTRDNALRDA